MLKDCASALLPPTPAKSTLSNLLNTSKFDRDSLQVTEGDYSQQSFLSPNSSISRNSGITKVNKYFLIKF